LNNSNKGGDWLILACFIREQSTADATFTRLENKVWFEIQPNARGNYRILYLLIDHSFGMLAVSQLLTWCTDSAEDLIFLFIPTNVD